jgi:probable phosphoglycerate mutase
MKKIILIRHAQSTHNISDLTGGKTKSPLTPIGKKQNILLADRLAHEYKNQNITIYSSTLLRARQTANLIAQKLNKPLNLSPLLDDIDLGLAAEKTESQAKKIQNPLTEPLIHWQPYPQAETWAKFYKRTEKFFPAIKKTQSIPIIIAHYGTIVNIICIHLNITLEYLADHKIAFENDPASITILSQNRWKEKTIKILNDTQHLRPLQNKNNVP